MVESNKETIESTETKSKDLSIKECLNPLPSNCFPLVHQVAGHFYGKGRTKLGTCLLLRLSKFLNKAFKVYCKHRTA